MIAISVMSVVDPTQLWTDPSGISKADVLGELALATARVRAPIPISGLAAPITGKVIDFAGFFGDSTHAGTVA